MKIELAKVSDIRVGDYIAGNNGVEFVQVESIDDSGGDMYRMFRYVRSPGQYYFMARLSGVYVLRGVNP